LRERLNDLPRIAESYLYFFARQCGKPLTGLSRDALQAMQQYPWPGNLRELRNVIERAVILAGSTEIDLPDLPEKFSRDPPPAGPGLQIGAKVSLEELENEHIARVVEQTATMEEAAKVLKIDPATLSDDRVRAAPRLRRRHRPISRDEEFPILNSRMSN